MNVVVILFGLLIIGAGLLILLLRPNTPGGSFNLKSLGVQFEFKVAGLVVMAFGLILVSMGPKVIPDDERVGTVTPTPSVSTGTPTPTPTHTVSPTPTRSVEQTTGGPKVITGNWTQTTNGLTLTVLEVRIDESSLELVAEVKNRTGDDISMPLFGNLSAVDDAANNYKPDSFGSDWPDSIAAGATVRGTIRFETGVKDAARYLNIKFTTIYGTFKVKSIAVNRIPLR